MHVSKLAVFIAFCAYIAFSGSAHAYLDPGTGSLLVQGIIASIAAVTTFLALSRQKLVEFFKRKKKTPDDLR